MMNPNLMLIYKHKYMQMFLNHFCPYAPQNAFGLKFLRCTNVLRQNRIITQKEKKIAWAVLTLWSKLNLTKSLQDYMSLPLKLFIVFSLSVFRVVPERKKEPQIACRHFPYLVRLSKSCKTEVINISG